MSMVPPDAPRSEDGRWWWDGATWQPLPDGGTAPAEASAPTQGSPGPAASTTGQLSDDGQWQWDGSHWEPATGGAPGSAPAADSQRATGEGGVEAGSNGSEPTLYDGDLDVDGWVETLQLALARAGQHVAVDGKFGDLTKDAVLVFQQEHSLEADGIVGNATWAALMGREAESPGVRNPPHGGLYPADGRTAHQGVATAHQGVATEPQPPAATPVPGNPYVGSEWASYWDAGWAAGFTNPDPGIQPPADITGDGATVWLDGAATAQRNAQTATESGPQIPAVEPQDGPTPPGVLPSFRLNIPDAELGQVTIPTGVYVLVVSFGLRGGNLTVEPPGATPGLAVDSKGFRYQVQTQLQGLFSGIRLSGIDGIPPTSVTIGTAWGNQFTTTEVQYVSPNQLKFIGQAVLPDLDLPTDAGDAHARGQFGFYVSVTIEMDPPPVPAEVPEEAPWYERGWDWVGEHATGLVVGTLIITASVVIVVVAPESAPAVAEGAQEALEMAW